MLNLFEVINGNKTIRVTDNMGDIWEVEAIDFKNKWVVIKDHVKYFKSVVEFCSIVKWECI